MGLIASKKAEQTIVSSPAFTAACDSIYADCLSEAQHAFPGLRRYQLPDAAVRLRASLSTTIPLIDRWVPSSPSQDQVDAALRRLDPDAEWENLSPTEFRAFAAELFREAVVSGVNSTVIQRVSIGAASIGGIGIVSHVGAGPVGRMIGVYAAGVAAAVYLSLS